MHEPPPKACGDARSWAAASAADDNAHPVRTNASAVLGEHSATSLVQSMSWLEHEVRMQLDSIDSKLTHLLDVKTQLATLDLKLEQFEDVKAQLSSLDAKLEGRRPSIWGKDSDGRLSASRKSTDMVASTTPERMSTQSRPSNRMWPSRRLVITAPALPSGDASVRRSATGHGTLLSPPPMRKVRRSRASMVSTGTTDVELLSVMTPIPSGQATDRGPGIRSTIFRRHWSSVGVRRPGGQVMRLLTRFHRHEWTSCLWNFLEVPESSVGAKWYSKSLMHLILLSVGITLLQTVEAPRGKAPNPVRLSGMPAAAMEIFFDVIFIIDFALRLLTCPNWRAFALHPYNVIDFVATTPFFLRAAVGFVLSDQDDGSIERMILLGIVPVVRLLKTLRHFEQFHLLLSAFQIAFEALPVLLFTLLVIVLSFSSMIYAVETRDNIDSLPTAIWLTIVTMATVGYGDLVPRSPPGYVVVSALIICSAMFMAIPLGIIGNSFSRVWEDRDRLLLMRRMRERLVQEGFDAVDIQLLFQHFSSSKAGELTLNDFRGMISEMKIGISDARTVELFHSLDVDGNGTINDMEFIRALFPGTYVEALQPKQDGEKQPGKDSDWESVETSAEQQRGSVLSQQAEEMAHLPGGVPVPATPAEIVDDDVEFRPLGEMRAADVVHDIG
eukprot:TRINITY_DN59721_c0_g1_i1.p1 TRINITY_DN59721_c0_g1~~TRINITY_DN59721_c0_g1_i1.p1  ORF type:complete len:669 (-),score=140.82 TRINITY_DN59721_c0_g1_i1:139-2145(-)